MRGGQSKLGYCPIRGDTGIPRLRDGHEVTRFPLRKEVGHDSGSAVEGLGVFFLCNLKRGKQHGGLIKPTQDITAVMAEDTGDIDLDPD